MQCVCSVKQVSAHQQKIMQCLFPATFVKRPGEQHHEAQHALCEQACLQLQVELQSKPILTHSLGGMLQHVNAFKLLLEASLKCIAAFRADAACICNGSS
jgi:hypothetical protein